MSVMVSRAPLICGVLALCAWRCAPAAEPVKQVTLSKVAAAEPEFLEFLGGDDDVEDEDWWDFLASGPVPEAHKPTVPDEDDSDE
jgi:hypothetical protein